MNKRTIIISTTLILVGIVGIAFAVDLWLIDSSSHYITISPVEAYFQYSLDNVTFANVTSCGANMSWFARMELNYAGANMQIRISWELWQPPGSWNTPLTFDTVFTLNTGWNIIYISPTGTQVDNYNWGPLTNPTASFAYRIRARVSEV